MNFKPVDPKSLKTKINDEIFRLTLTSDIYRRVLDVLSRHYGKKYIKRITDKIKEVLPNYFIYFDDQYGMFSLRIWGNNDSIKYDNKLSFFLGYKNSNPNKDVDMKFINEHNKREWIDNELSKLNEDLKKVFGDIDFFNEKLNEFTRILKLMEDNKSHTVYYACREAVKQSF